MYSYFANGFYQFTVPQLGPTTNMLVEMWGAHGGAPTPELASKPGYIKFLVRDVGNQTFNVRVGGSTTNSTGGFNGGGTTSTGSGYGGGGATALSQFILDVDFIACAAGGGGALDSVIKGGYGGGFAGGNGDSNFGTGGLGAVWIVGGEPGISVQNNVNGESLLPMSSEPGRGIARKGGDGYAAGGGGGLAGGAGGGRYNGRSGGAGGGSSGILYPSPFPFVNQPYIMELIENTENATNRPQIGTLLDGCAIIRAFDATSIPTVTILTPTSNQNFKVSQPISLTASATGNLSVQVDSISWYANNNFIGHGLSLNWTPTNSYLGIVNLRCQVMDINGGVATDSVSISVVAITIPTVSILAPMNNSKQEQNLPLTLTGTAFDTYYGNLSNFLVWTSSKLMNPLGTGASIIVSAGTLPLGTQKITATVTNNDGIKSFETYGVTIIDTIATVITITEPTRTIFSFGETFVATAVATTSAGVDVSSSIKWILPNGIMLNNFASINVNTMLFAQNTPLTLRAQIVDGANIREDTFVFTVSSEPLPSIVIDSPFEFGVYLYDNSIIFSGMAQDFPTQDISNQITWTSSIDGVLAVNSASFTKKLSVGIHKVTASVMSSLGPIEAVVNFKVEYQKFALVQISSPVTGDVFEQNQSITFVGAALSNTFEDISNLIEWSSNLEGALGVGSSIAVPITILGDHIVTAFVRDSDNFTASNSITITIASAPCIRRGSLVATATSYLPIQDLASGIELLDWRGNRVELRANVLLPLKSKEFIKIPAYSLGSSAPNRDFFLRVGHPILVDSQEIPCEYLIGHNDISLVQLDQADEIFTLITDQRTFVLINNVPVATWGKAEWELELERHPLHGSATYY